tara:strand:+ start:211 stop:450 length:240 start_codon:yes stop_codon:yes gene_type:complete
MKFIFLFNRFLTHINDKYLIKFKKKGISRFNKKDLYGWMNLTKKERFDMSKKDSEKYSNERKYLLNQIRNEYKNLTEKK